MFTDYYNTSRAPIFMIGFVDDCTQRVNLFERSQQPSSTELFQLMTEDAQLWNDLLWASGGALEQSKCSFHFIESDWTSHGHPFLKGGTSQETICLEHNGRQTRVKQKSNYDAHKTLGCYINPAYTRKQPFQAIAKKNETFSQLLETNSFTRQETWTFYTAIYLPSITYSLPITPLTREQCTQVDSRFFRALLPRCGYNRNMSRAIRYAPFHMGGAGFKELYVEQGALMLQQVYKFLNSPNTQIGQLLLMAISWTQAFLGTSKLFLTYPHEPIPPCEPSFLLDLRDFLQHINGSLRLKTPPSPVMLRKYDRCIMDIVVRQHQWKKAQVIQINACRRYLQAQSLADITNIQGTRITPEAVQGTFSSQHGSVRIATFNQQRPKEAAWKTWRRFLLTISNKYGVLRQPLEEWTHTVEQTRHWPLTIYDPGTDTLMTHHRQSEYLQHHRYRPGCFSINPTDQVSEARGFPTATNITMGMLRPVGNFKSTTSDDKVTLELGVVPPIQAEQWEYELLGYTRLTSSLDNVRMHVSRWTLITCSDGSVTNDSGSFGFVVASQDGTRLVKGHGPAPGAYPNSFRSEAYGVLATVQWLHSVSQFFPSGPDDKVTHYMDNTSVINRIKRSLSTTWDVPNLRLLPEQDVIDEIVTTVRSIPITIEFKWVKGHQDLRTEYRRLPLPAQLNCDADHEAELWQRPDNIPQTCVPPLPHTPSQLLIQDLSVTGHLKRRVHESIAFLG